MKDRKNIIGRINSDADLSVFPENEMPDCQNVSHVIAADGRIAAMKPVNGNRKIPYIPSEMYAFPISGKTVGSFTEDEKGRIYWFVYDPAGEKHQILCYFKHESKVRLIFHSKYLGFTGVPITGIDKIGDILYWVEDGQHPRKINVERGLQTYSWMSLNQVSYINNDVAPVLKDITLIRPNPQFPVSFVKIATNQAHNFISDYSFQFAYRYIYRDKEVSVLSPYSLLANYNSKDQDTEGLDAINISVPLQEQIPWEVDKIQLLVREKNIGTFFIIKQWDRLKDGLAMLSHNSGTPLSYVFYNDQNGIAISEEESSKPFDNVPIYSRALSAARNRLFLGNNVFGYDKVVSGGIVAKYTGSLIEGGSTVKGSYVFVSLTQVPTQEYPSPAYYERIYLRVEGSGQTDGYYNLDNFGFQLFDFDGAALPKQVFVTDAMKALSLETGDVNSYLSDDLQKDTAGYGVPVEFPLVFDTVIKRTYTGGDVTVGGLPGTQTAFENSVTFKSGSKYQVGIVFYDFAGRNAGVYSTPTSVVRTIDRTYLSAIASPYISVELSFNSEDIPVWAETYQVVRTRNLTYQSFVQGFSSDIQYVGKSKDGNYEFGETSASVFSETFNSNTIQGVAINISGITSFGLGYQYSEGDYVKIWFADNKTDRVNIISQVGSYIIVQAKDFGTLALNSSSLLYEIVVPRKSFLEETFYEVGKAYPVNNHGTDTRSLSNATVILSGDTFVTSRIQTGSNPVQVETMNPSDMYWYEWLSDIGRPNIVFYNKGRSTRDTSICYSNTYVQSTEVNGLSSFDTLDFRDLDFTVGAIRKLILTNRTQEYGSVMLAICETETASIYLGENRIVDNADNVILATSGEVIGTINPLKGSFGTVHPESVYGSEGRVYFVDAVNGKVISYTQNGLEPISQNGMTKFFTSNLFEINSSQRGIYGVIDKRSEMYMVYMPQGGYTYPLLMDYNPPKPSPHHVKTGCVLCYNPELQGWTTRLTFKPEWMDATSAFIVSWIGGEIYVHDTEVYNNFYDVIYPSTVSFVVGNPQVFVKTLDAIAIEGNKPPNWVHVRNEHPYTQSTDLEASEFVSKEGVHYASFLRDRLTPGKESYDAALLLGEPVRGQFLTCAIQYNGGAFFYVNGITVSYDKSLGHSMLEQQG